MNRYVRPNSSCSSSSRLMICAWIETSRAETGSSATMKSGLTRKRAREADPLALAARELVRIARRRIRAAGRRSAAARAPAARPSRRDASPCARIGSPTMRATLCRGFSDANGSWKTICIRRRSGRSSLVAEVGDVLPVEADAARRSACTAAGWRGRPSTCRNPTRRPGRASRPGGCRWTRRRLPDVADVPVEDDPALDREPDLQVLEPDERPPFVLIRSPLRASWPTRPRAPG